MVKRNMADQSIANANQGEVMSASLESQEAKAEELHQLLDEAEKLPRDSGELEEKAVSAFIHLLRELQNRRHVINLIADKKSFYPHSRFEIGAVCEGIFLSIPKETIYLDMDGDLSGLFGANQHGEKIKPRALAKVYGAGRCVDYLLSAIRQRIDEIKTNRDSNQRAIEMVEAIFPK